MGISEQSNKRTVRENLWYFNEETVNIHSLIQEKELEEDSGKLVSYKKIINETSTHFIPKTHGSDKLKEECSFVVDWQLSDSL